MKIFQIVILIQFFIFPIMNAQTGEFCSLESALASPKEVKTLFINYNFEEIKNLPKEIGDLENLEELIFFPRLFDFPKIEGKQIVANELDDSILKTMDFLPVEISKCKKLRVMDFQSSSLSLLPKLKEFPQLEKLKLSNSSIDLDKEMENLLSIENDVTLEIADCIITEANLEKLKAKKNLEILVTKEDFESAYEEVEKEEIDLQMGSMYMVFTNWKDANRFVNSVPELLREKAKQSLNKK